MKGGVNLFRGNGAAERRHVETDRSPADEYYLSADDAVAEYGGVGDPHRHIHMQIGTRVFASGKWRAPDTAIRVPELRSTLRVTRPPKPDYPRKQRGPT